MKVANCAEFLMWESDIPTNGVRMETGWCLDNWYVEELMKDMHNWSQWDPRFVHHWEPVQ